MSWRAWPEGHPSDLETLGELFGEGDPLVAKDSSGRYYLEASALQDPDGQIDDDAAEALVRHMNGAARATYRGFRPVHRGQYTAPDGTVHIVAKGGISLRAQENEAFDTVEPVRPEVPGASRGSRYLKLAEQDEGVATALRILGRPEPLDWYDLYKVWEIVEHAAGGIPQVVARGWATKADIERFTASANHPGISGDNARHAWLKGKTPGQNRVMPIAEGSVFVRQLTANWIESHRDC
jgi:hypothetical protein